MAIENNTPAEPQNTPSDELSFEQIDSLLSFDPFSQEPSEPTPPADESPAAPTAVPAEGEAAAAPAQEGQPAEQPPQPAQDPEKELLRQQLTTMQAQLDAMRQQPPQQPPSQQAPTDGGIPVPEYNFNIPDALVDHLRSENPAEFRTGISALLQGVAQTVHRQVTQQMVGMVQEVVPQMVNQGVTGATMAREIFSDFYGTHKDLNVPELRPLVTNVATQVATEFRATQWSPQLRDETARRVKAILAGHAPAPTTPPQPPAEQPSGRPPVQFGGNGARTSAAPQNPTVKDIQRTLFGG